MNKVLIADDDQNISNLIKIYLEDRMGFQCEVVSNAVHALANIHEEVYSLVISDFQMPGTFDGINVVTACLERGIPFIIMSGNENDLIKEASQRLDKGSLVKVMGRFMPKPISLIALNRMVKNSQVPMKS